MKTATKLFKTCIILTVFFHLQKELAAQATNRIDTVGRVGIGTTSPNNPLSVNGNADFGTTSYSYTGHPHYGALMFPRGQLLFSNSNGQNQMYLTSNAYLNSAGSFLYRNTGVAAGIGIDNGGIALFTADPGSVNAGVSFQNRLYVANDGNVGIGTNTPTPGYKLTVNGNADFGNSIQISGTPSTSPLGTGVGYGLFSYSGTGLGIFSAASGPAQGIGIWTNTSQGPKESVRILSGGDVGIGTITPTEKLSVNGNISAKKIIVTQTGWSDYVFNKAYKLRSLSSLETYIDQHKHLPEMPSAKEVEEKGISVGDNQALLLKKIEELTLYVIVQQKQIESMAAKIKKLENKK